MAKTVDLTKTLALTTPFRAPVRKRRFLNFVFGSLMFLALPASAMQALEDADLAGVAGQDGLTLQLDGNISAQSIKATLDAGTGSEAAVTASTVDFVGVDPTGVPAGNAGLKLNIDVGNDGIDPLLSIDLATTSRSRLRIDDLTVSGPSSRTYGTWAFDFDANVKLVNKGIFNMSYNKAYLLGEIINGDLFYSQDGDAWMGMHDFLLRWEIPEGTLGVDSEGVVHRAGKLWGEAGFSDTATNSNLINLALDFEYLLGKKQAGNEFQITTDARGLMHFGWLGSVKNAELKWQPGGVWYTPTNGVFDPYGASAVTSNGLRFSSQWDFVSQAEAAALGDSGKEFRWRLGETADVASTDQSRVNFELGDWAIWGTRTAAKPAAHYFPLIALDVIAGAGQGPGGLCWGHGLALVNGTGGGSGCGSTAEPGTQFINMTPGNINNYGITETSAHALALIIRGGQLQSYSRKVRLLERNAAGVETSREFNWGLIYSLANVSANIYLYPGITRDDVNGDDNQGVIADLLVMSQTLDGNNQGQNWDHGTHLMIADTDANMGIGFMSSSFVVAGNDTRIWVKPQTGSDYYSGGLDIFSPQSRFNYRATFGGGLLPGHASYDPVSTTVPQTVNGANIDLNLEGLVNLRFSPSDPASAFGDNYLAYSGALRLGSNEGNGMIGATSTLSTCGSSGDQPCGSYISLAEPSQPEAAIKLANITGDLVFTEGRVDLVGTGELGSGSEPQMVLANKIKVGYAAADHLNPILASAGMAEDAGNPVLIDNIMLGNANLGRMVIPSAQIYSSITLEPQSASVPFAP